MENFNADNLNFDMFEPEKPPVEEPKKTTSAPPQEVKTDTNNTQNVQAQNSIQAAQQQQEKDQILAFGYSRNQWNLREERYIKALEAITLPPDVKPSDIQRVALQIDSLLTQVHIDDIRIQQKFNVYQQQLKIMEKTLYTSIKMAGGTQKLTVDEIKGLVSDKINKTPWNNTNFSLYTLVQEYSMRSIFTQSMIESLREKKDLLITHSGILKIENAVGNFSGNVPQNIPDGNYYG